MLETLKIRIKESERPVGTKRPSKIKLPPEDHVYGLEVKRDPEGLDVSKSLIFLLVYSPIIFLNSLT